MARLDELVSEFTPQDAPEVDMATMPDEISGMKPAPYPGRYIFQLPPELNFDAFEVEKGPEGQRRKTKRLRVLFDDSHPLTIVGASAVNTDWIGQPAGNIRISNSEYPVGEERLMVSEMGFMLKKGFKEILPTNAGNIEYAKTLVTHVNQKFSAEVEWSSYCDPDRKRYVWDPAQNRNVEDANTGCGQRWGQHGYTKKDGTVVKQIRTEDEEIGGVVQRRFAETFLCDCGASLRCFPRLRNYDAVE